MHALFVNIKQMWIVNVNCNVEPIGSVCTYTYEHVAKQPVWLAAVENAA